MRAREVDEGNPFVTGGVVIAAAAFAALLIWWSYPASAQMSTPANDLAARTVDLGGWIPVLQAIATASVPIIGTLLLMIAKRFLTIHNEAAFRQTIDLATTNAAGLVVAVAGNQLQGRTFDIGSPVAAQVLDYLAKAAPDAIKHFGLGDSTLLEKVTAKLPQIAATSSQPIVVAGSFDQPGPGMQRNPTSGR